MDTPCLTINNNNVPIACLYKGVRSAESVHLELLSNQRKTYCQTISLIFTPELIKLYAQNVKPSVTNGFSVWADLVKEKHNFTLYKT